MSNSSWEPLLPGRKLFHKPALLGFLMAEEDGQFYGSLTLVVFLIPTGTRGWIEDVVVSEDARGKGVGRLISERAVSLANELGAKTIDLTSRPSRTIENNLFKKIGFVQRETNIYRYSD